MWGHKSVEHKINWQTADMTTIHDSFSSYVLALYDFLILLILFQISFSAAVLVSGSPESGPIFSLLLLLGLITSQQGGETAASWWNGTEGGIHNAHLMHRHITLTSWDSGGLVAVNDGCHKFFQKTCTKLTVYGFPMRYDSPNLWL